MNTVSVIDTSFDIKITTSYFLSIQLQLDGFSFCVLDPVSNQYIQFNNRPLKPNENILDILEWELSKNNLLVYPYQKIFVLYNTSKYSLIPQALYDKKHHEDYLSFCFSEGVDLQTELVFANKIKMADSICVFKIPLQLSTILDKYFKNIQYFCQATPFIETALLSTPINMAHNHVHIHIQPSGFYFDIIVTSGNNLKMHNTFKYHDKKEFLYFTLFVFEQIKLDTHNTKVFLSGNIEKSNETYALLKKYVKQVEIDNTTKHFKFSGIFKHLSIQNHLNLFNIPLCV
ncbi:Protein of unknown function [Saccharicrinis carchari]|uniref:DUF3822 domain-containing protein n=1 Tax=Saccharicrinis carchari TaxID=1168039 RepID=A0A521AQN7_SACCC|nr:DUF3822 family protein [Saccharicrinis carchari]SMO36970.1 Protein of unknown function [Saccharicrinis carchari]